MEQGRKKFGILAMLFLVLMIVTLVFVRLSTVSAVEYPFDVIYDVFPHGGKSSDEILVFIRVEHPTVNEPMWAYVFWDSRVIAQRVPNVIVNKVNQHRWDINFYPPTDLCSKGIHTISIWVEDGHNNLVRWMVYKYTISDVVPLTSWWNDLPQAFTDSITGPVGPVGPRGVQGKTGVAGLRGPEGDEGPEGPEGPVGDVGPKGPEGERGSRGPAGVQGEVGSIGPQGELNTISLMVSIVIGAFALILGLLNFFRSR